MLKLWSSTPKTTSIFWNILGSTYWLQAIRKNDTRNFCLFIYSQSYNSKSIFSFLETVQSRRYTYYFRTIFLLLPVAALNAMFTIKLRQKQLWRNSASVNLKLKKVKLFTQSSTKICCISVFNVRGCLASCLNFRLFLTLDP